MDQACVSGTRFGIAFILARYTTPTEFGAFALAFSVLLLANGIQSALITGPMLILGPGREDSERRRYITTLAVVQAATGALVCICALGVCGLMWLAGASASLQGAFLGLASAIFFTQSQEFIRRSFFARLMPARVLLNDVLCFGLQLVGVAALWRLDAALPETDRGWLSARNAFLCIAGASLFASTVGLLQMRSLMCRSLRGARSFIRENVSFGKWNLGHFLGIYLVGRGSSFVIAAFAGVAGVAALEAPRLLLAPLQVVMMGMGNIVTPRAAAKLAVGGKPALLSFLAPVSFLWAFLCIGYAAAIALAPGMWLTLFYGDKYTGAETLLVLWALFWVLNGLMLLPSMAIGVMRRPDLTMYGSLAVGVLVIPISVLLAYAYGATGAFSATILGKLALLVIFVIVSTKLFRNTEGPSTANDPCCRLQKKTP